jgi:hypothetical protein
MRISAPAPPSKPIGVGDFRNGRKNEFDPRIFGFGFEREGRSHGRCFSLRKMRWKKKPNMTNAKELSSYILP